MIGFKPLLLLLLALTSIMAAQLTFTNIALVKEGTAAADLIRIMGGEPTRKTNSVPGAELWIWEKKSRRDPPEVASFEIYEGKVLQAPLLLTNRMSPLALRVLLREREMAATQKIEEIKAQRRKAEIEQRNAQIAAETQKRLLQEFFQHNPQLDPDLKARMEKQEMSYAEGLAEYDRRKFRKKADQDKAKEAQKKMRVAEYLKANPSLDSKIASAMTEAKPAIGMTTEQLLLIWGEPIKRSKTINRDGETSVWTYPWDDTQVSLASGIITSWTMTERPQVEGDSK
jgi:hypothetical protein